MKSDLQRFGRGFVYAWNGIRAAVWEERNFRFHMCAACYAVAAGLIAKLQRQEWALLCLCVAAVMAMELMNSAVERAVDKPDTTHWWSAGAAKDMAAGAVLLTALGAAVVGLLLFAMPDRLALLWQAVFGSLPGALLWAGSLALAYAFTFKFGAKKEKGTPTNEP